MVQKKKKKNKASSVNFTYKKIANWFFVLAIILVGVILYFSLSQAKIYLKIKSQPAKINFTTQIKEQVEDDNYLETNVLKGRILELIMEKTRAFSVESQQSPADKYGGIMTIYNKKPEDQPLVKNTRFESANGKIFRTQEGITIPAGQSIEIYVVADEIGEDYKELPGRFILPGFKNEYSRTRVYGELKDPMEKRSITSYVVSQEVLNQAQKEIISGLKNDALHKLEELLVGGEILEENDINIELLSYESSQEVGEEAEEFEYTVKLKIIGIIFDHSELLNLAQSFIDDQLGNNQELVKYNNDTLKYSINNYEEEEKSVILGVELSAEVMRSTNSEIFDKERLKSLTQAEIINYFKEQPAIESIEVIFFPFWVKRAPQMANHIKIIIND